MTRLAEKLTDFSVFVIKSLTKQIFFGRKKFGTVFEISLITITLKLS
jgi:hypothetical protein